MPLPIRAETERCTALLAGQDVMTPLSCLTCPRCQAHLQGALGIEVSCSHCEQTFETLPGYVALAPAEYYWGEIPQDAMQLVLSDAKAVGWRQAVSMMLQRSAWENGLNNICGPARADWLPEMPLGAGLRALDIASGWGQIAFRLCEWFDEVFSLEGIEERAQFQHLRREQDDVRNLTIVAANLVSLPFEKESFDVVVMNGIVEWLGLVDLTQNPRDVQLAVLRQVRKIMKPGACLYIGIENRFSYTLMRGSTDHSGLRYTSLLPRWAADIAVRAAKPDNARTSQGARAYRTYTYTPRGYRKLLSEAGFSDVAVKWVLPGYNEPLESADMRWPDLLEHRVNSRRFRRKAALKRFVARAFCRSRLHSLVMPHVSILSNITGSRVPSLIDRVCSEMQRRGLELDRTRWLRRSSSDRAHVPSSLIHYECFGERKREPIAFVKIPRGRAGVAQLEREREALSRLPDESPASAKTRNAHYLSVDGIPVLCEPYFSGSSFRMHLLSVEAHDRVIEWVLRLQQSAQGDNVRLCLLERCNKTAAKAAALATWPAGVANYVETVLLRLREDSSLCVLPVVAHGDLTAPNVLLSRDEVFVTDWEWIDRKAAPTFDIWHFLTSNSMRVDNAGECLSEQDPRQILETLGGKSPYASTFFRTARKLMQATDVSCNAMIAGFIEMLIVRVARDAEQKGSTTPSVYLAILELLADSSHDLHESLTTGLQPNGGHAASHTRPAASPTPARK